MTERRDRDAGKDKRYKAAAALHYSEGQNPIPKVVAVGRGHLAEQIEDLAVIAGIPVYEHPELAWKLVGLGVDREIPAELYELVAQIIAWVYFLENRKNKETRQARQRRNG